MGPLRPGGPVGGRGRPGIGRGGAAAEGGVWRRIGGYSVIIRGFYTEIARSPEPIFGIAAAPAAAARPRAAGGDPMAAKTPPATPLMAVGGVAGGPFWLKNARFRAKTGRLRPRQRPKSAPWGPKRGEMAALGSLTTYGAGRGEGGLRS